MYLCICYDLLSGNFYKWESWNNSNENENDVVHNSAWHNNNNGKIAPYSYDNNEPS